jgi:hypothetical protein
MSDQEVSRVAVEELTASAFSGVLRAIEARKLPIEKIPGPILVGIIWWPELRQGIGGLSGGAAAGGAAAGGQVG